MILDEKGRVLTMNRAAEAILHQKDGLGIARGVLCADAADVALKMKDSMRKAFVNTTLENTEHVVVPRRNSERPLLMEFCPTAAAKRSPACVVFVTDPDAISQINAHLLQTLFQITPTEAHLATLLAEGHDVGTICDKLDVSSNTVRTHLKRLFNKTNTSRQAELVRLILNAFAL
jgi:DNA-binding CsgD family transcriptional regulator